MSARLRAMREDEFETYLARSRAGYADDMIRNGRMPPDVAHRKAQADLELLYGRAAMELLEAEVRELGLGHVQLNVFGGNAAARSLYRSLDFQELWVQMGKDLQ